MTSDHSIPQHTNGSRKRAATDNETPPPKRHHPDAIEQLLETIKFQIDKATDIWVHLNSDEDKVSDADPVFLGLLKSAVSSGNLAVKMVEGREPDVVEHE